MYNDKPSPGFKYRPRLGVWTDGVNNVFDPNAFEARSYHWWTYVAKINGKVVFNAYPYSATTQNHQRNMLALLKRLKIKVDITVSMRQNLSSFHSDALPYMYNEMFTIELEGKRARKDGVFVQCHQKYYKTRAKAIMALRESIKTCRKLGAKMTQTEIKACKKYVSNTDKKRLDYARQKRIKAAQLTKELKPVLNDLGPISMNVYKDVNDLNEVTLELGDSNA